MTESDWKKAKTEYITKGVSQREIAKKYGVDPATIGRRASKEGWLEARQQHDSEVSARTIKAAEDTKVRREQRILAAGDRLLDIVTEFMENAEGIVPKEFRQISATLLDLKELHGIKSEADLREQEARITALLAKNNSGTDDENETGVILLPPVKEN